jgi:hypothetical protein
LILFIHFAAVNGLKAGANATALAQKAKVPSAISRLQ